MRFHLVAAIAALTIGATHATALSADLGADFSVTNSNPNGAWTYGYETTLGGAFTAHTTTFVNSTHEYWYTSGLTGNFTPCVFKNTTSTTIDGLAGGKLGMHAGPSGQFSVARYTSSEATAVSIDGLFGAGDINSVSCYVVVDGAVVFGRGDTYQGENFSLTTTLAAGSTVDFIVGVGFGSYGWGTTPVAAKIESVPEPASMVALSAAGLLAARRRRRK